MVRQFLQITLQRSSARSSDPQTSQDESIGDGALAVAGSIVVDGTA
jgi:hypothetical protein